jgi:heat shock protein HslJ
MNTRLTTLLALALLTTACAGAPADELTLNGRQFLSVDVTVNDVQRPLVAGTRIRISFTADSVGATAGCNHMSGRYRLQGGRLIVDQMGMTEMGCDPALHDQDTWLAAFLGAQPQVRLSGADLVLESSGTIVRLLDREVAEPDLPLLATRWTLTTITDRGAASSVPEGVQSTLELSPDGNFSLHAGCNQGGGRYEFDGSMIRFSDVALTRMACDDARSQVETAVLAVIGADGLSFSIDANNLTLNAGDRGLVYSAER